MTEHERGVRDARWFLVSAEAALKELCDTRKDMSYDEIRGVLMDVQIARERLNMALRRETAA